MKALFRRSSPLPLLGCLVLASACNDDGLLLPDAGATPVDGLAPDGAGPAPDAGAPLDGAPPSDGPPPEAGALYGDQPFSIVLLPDTQFYALAYPEMFRAEAAWIVAQKEAEKIAFVLHLGDIVDNYDQQPQWDRANEALKMLEVGHVPYVVCAGNHDLNVGTRQGPLLNQNFPPSRFAPSLQGTFENKIDDAYYFLPAGGRTWLIVSLEFGPRDEVVTWADGIFRQNADKPAILLTHAYMYLGEQRYDQLHHPEQFWNPHGYNMPGTTNDGEEMFQKMVAKNDNILMVVSGHATLPEGAAGRLSTKRANGYYLHEMLSNYQGCPVDYQCVNRQSMKPVRGGEGNIRIIRVDPPNRRASVETYSPYLKMSMMDPAHTFELPLE
jgi:hypothetical protein